MDIKYAKGTRGEYTRDSMPFSETQQTRSSIHRSKRSTPLRTPLVHLSMTYLTHTLRPVLGRQIYCCTPPATTPPIHFIFRTDDAMPAVRP
jgi:hypothetical protein